ncbi:MAG TPA: SH3 domain-containing protein [Caulobacteraceae bacterium]|nr:SH3 domain-containing protein [Caulobacteraceae bacterium]
MSRRAIFCVAASIGALAALGACEVRGGEGSDCPAGVQQATPSGYCVPRYVSLKRGEVFGRKGPGADYATVYVYHVRGLPVQVVDETADWRRICDPDGGSAWVSSAMLDGRRTVMALGAAPVALRRDPGDASPANAYLRPRSVAALTGRSRDGQKGDWREVSVDGAKGWVKWSEVWGLATGAQCR